MKKSLFEDTHRILELMGGVLTELNQKYLDQILDKINDSGIDSLSDHEKMALDKLSNDEDVDPPEDKTSLSFTSVGDPVLPKGRPYTITGEPIHTVNNVFISGKAESLAKSKFPIFIEGDLSELDKSEYEQRITMVVSNGEYECIASPIENEDTGEIGYQLKLKDDEEAEELFGMNEDDMLEYKVFDDGEMNEPLDMTEGNAFVEQQKKAKEDGKDSFELNGKTYKVSITKSNDNN